MLSAEELLARGRVAGSGGRLAQARHLLARAADRATDPGVAARIQVTTAYVVAESGNPKQAEAMCRQVIANAALVGPRATGLAWSQVGLLRMRAGDLNEATRCFAEAVTLLEDDTDLGIAWINTGNIALQRGDLALARSALSLADEHFGRTEDHVEQAKAGHNLAYVELLLGDLPKALRGMETHRSVLVAQGPVSQAINDQDRAEALLAAGFAGEADAALERAARAFGSRRLSQFQGEAELVRARALLMLDPAEARRVARAASGRFRRRGSRSWQLRADVLDVLALANLGGRSPRLLAMADGLIPQLKRQGLFAEAAEVALAACRVLLNRGQDQTAAGRLHRVKLPDSAPLPSQLLKAELSAEIAERQGRPGDALRHVRSGLAQLHDWQSSFGSLDLQTNLVVHGRGLADRGLRIALATGSPELCFEWSERSRTLVNRVRPVRPPKDPLVAAELAELRFLSTTKPSPRSAEGMRMADLRESVRQHAWYGEGSGEVTEPVTLAHLQAMLTRDRAALVAYLGLAEEVVALVATGESATLVPLGPVAPVARLLDSIHADLDMAATDLPESLAEVVTSSANDGIRELARLLVQPLLSHIGDRRVVLTPSGVLARTPWTLLPGFEGRPLAVPQSATRWLEARERPPTHERVVGFVAGPGVLRAEKELRAAQQQWGGGVLLVDAEATVAQTKRVAEDSTVLHIAAHGRHAPDNPLFSGLELIDGTFYGYDIDQVQSLPEVVLLSACEVGRATVTAGEETVGMTAAWLHAGVSSVISSCALIGDAAAEDVLVRVHQQLAAGLSPAEALAIAQAESEELAPLVCYGVGW